MLQRVAFTVSGPPVAWGRPRAHARIVGFGKLAKAIVQFFTDPKINAAEKRIRAIGKAIVGDNQPFTGAVRMTIVAIYEAPPSWPKPILSAVSKGVVFHTSKPDADNVFKLVGDAMNGVAYVDDCQVAELILRKRYGTPARTEVTITPLSGPNIAESPADRRRAKEQAALQSPTASPEKGRSAPKSAPVLDVSQRLL